MTYKNPVFNTKTFKNSVRDDMNSDVQSLSQANYNNYILNGYVNQNSNQDVMTLDGTMGKTFVLMSVVLASATFGWKYLSTIDPSSQLIWIVASSILAFCVALILCFNVEQAPIFAPVYAILEGFAIGGLSMLYGMQYEGIVLHAIGLTVGVLFSMILVYTSGLFKPSKKFQMGLFMVTLAIIGVYMIDILGFYLFHFSIPMLHASGVMGITVGALVVSLAAFYLLADFALIEDCVNQKQPKYMEWYCAYGLMVTIIWLYLEILRLLSKK